VGEAITRNKSRLGKEQVPPAGIGGTFKKLEPPDYEEGFHEIFHVTISGSDFVVKAIEINNDST
jgi:hypothetical protein